MCALFVTNHFLGEKNGKEIGQMLFIVVKDAEGLRVQS